MLSETPLGTPSETRSVLSSPEAWYVGSWAAMYWAAVPQDRSVLRRMGTAEQTTQRQQPKRQPCKRARERGQEARAASRTPFRAACSRGAQRIRRARISRATKGIQGQAHPFF